MARCYLTGVEFPAHDGFVLNRGEAHRLLRALRARAESLERLIAQLSPMDMPTDAPPRATRLPPVKQNRMVCKAVADAVGASWPEIALFLAWPQILALRTVMRMRFLKDHPLYGPAISGLADKECVPVDRLGRQVLAMVDPHRRLSPRTRLAIAAGVCVQHRGESADCISAMIYEAIATDSDLGALGVPAVEHETVRAALMRLFQARSPDLPSHVPGRQTI